jgi:hypothetical protein
MEFKEKFDDTLSAMKAVGQDKPNAGDQAMDFLNKLNNSYTELRSTFDIMQALKLGKYPKTLADAYSFASQYKTVTKPVIKREQQPDAVFVSDATSEGARRKTKNISKKKSCSKCEDDDDTDNDKDRRQRKQYHNCPLCDKNHPAFKCPMLELCKKAIEDQGKIARQEIAAIAFQFEDENEDGYCESVVL